MISRAFQVVLAGVILACNTENSVSLASSDSAAVVPTNTDVGQAADAVTKHATPSDPSRTAALIAAMMLRFAQQDIRAFGMEASTEQSYIILPDGPRLTNRNLIDWLENAPKPLLAVPTYIRGMIAAWPAVTSSQIRHDLVNQQNIIAEFQETNELSDETVIALDAGTETVSFPLAHLKVWAANYVASAPWNIQAPQDSVPPRLVLIAPGRTPFSRP